MLSGLLSRTWHFLDVARRIIVNLLFVFIVLGLLTVILTQRPDVPDGVALVLNPSGALVEQITGYSPDLTFGTPRTDQSLMKDLLHAIDIARDDARIKLMFLDLKDMESSSLSKLQDLRGAILAFRASGKKVIVAADSYTQSQYYLAAAADEVYLHPMGMVMLSGFGLYRNYFRDALDKLSIDMHVFSVGEYKSAAEPLIRNNMSPQARSSNAVWLNQLWTAYKQDISTSRGIRPEDLQAVLSQPSQYLRKHQGNMASLARNTGLVDRLASRQDVEEGLIKVVGVDKEGGTFRQISYREYLRAIDSDIMHIPAKSPNKLAIIIANGSIVDGEQPSGTIGGDTMAGVLRSARMNDDIKAVVLRVDSPGGSALASEVIRQEVEKIRQSGKPVIASMGSLAASGGYWISMAADEIWASPVTLTGSIGVIGLFPNLHRSMESLGIHTDGIGTSPLAGAMRPDRPLNPEVARTFQMGVNHIYDQFVQQAAAGRGMEKKEMDQIARGRVWSGADALKIGLVDKLGGLDDAVVSAAEHADISDDYEIMYLEKEKTLQELLFEDLFSNASTWFGEKIAGVVPAIEPLSSIARELRLLTSSGNGVYAYCPCGDALIE